MSILYIKDPKPKEMDGWKLFPPPNLTGGEYNFQVVIDTEEDGRVTIEVNGTEKEAWKVFSKAVYKTCSATRPDQKAIVALEVMVYKEGDDGKFRFGYVRLKEFYSLRNIKDLQ